MKYLIPAIFLAISIQSFGQFNKGDKVLGGTLSFNMAKNENSQFGTVTVNNTFFGIYPNFGVLINSNLEIGGQLGYTSNNDEWSNTDMSTDRKLNDLTVGLYTQRYFVISDKFLFSLIGNISYSWGKEKTLITNQNDIVEDEINRNSIGVRFRPSFIFFPSPNWGLQASIGELGYTHTKDKTNDDTSNQFGINYGYVSFGIAYYFRRKVE
jgi:hypothetical protein